MAWHLRIGGVDALVNLGVMSEGINRGPSVSDLFLCKWLEKEPKGNPANCENCECCIC
ncbi:UNVERIFIED_CONTAM: hypothetical protein FKN15_022093 [Acipenser sinensis]